MCPTMAIQKSPRPRVLDFEKGEGDVVVVLWEVPCLLVDHTFDSCSMYSDVCERF